MLVAFDDNFVKFFLLVLRNVALCLQCLSFDAVALYLCKPTANISTLTTEYYRQIVRQGGRVCVCVCGDHRL